MGLYRELSLWMFRPQDALRHLYYTPEVVCTIFWDKRE